MAGSEPFFYQKDTALENQNWFAEMKAYETTEWLSLILAQV